MIEIICPSKGRPNKLRRMWESALSTADNPTGICLRVGVNEEEIPLYRDCIRKGNAVAYGVKDWTINFTLNLLAQAAMEDGVAKLFMLMGDDAVFTTPLWDKAVLEHYEALKVKQHVYALRDSRSAEGTPHPIITREFIEALGYIVPPIFLHWFSDTWVVEIAKRNNLFTHMDDYELIHDKPSDKGFADSTHMTPRNRGWLDRDKHVNATCAHYLDVEVERMRAKCLQ